MCGRSRNSSCNSLKDYDEYRLHRSPGTSTVLLFCLILSSFLVLASSTAAGAYVSVLLYHRFDEDRYPTTTTSSAQFEQHLSYLKANGYTVISMDHLAECVEGRRPLPDRAVVITIDDGFISEYERAVPLLRKYGIPLRSLSPPAVWAPRGM